MSEAEPAHAPHFATTAQQMRASELGMWLFIASEVLLFTGFFVLYAAYRVQFPEGFAEGIAHSSKVLGSLNTGILIVSSYLVARSVPAVRAGQNRLAVVLLSGTCLLGLAFLTLKGLEYASHIGEGMVPGGRSAFFRAHPQPGLPLFVNLYYLATATHALHVGVGLAVLSTFLVRIRRGAPPISGAHNLELGAMYWHLVDLIWIFLWPLFYLTHGGGS